MKNGQKAELSGAGAIHAIDAPSRGSGLADIVAKAIPRTYCDECGQVPPDQEVRKAMKDGLTEKNRNFYSIKRCLACKKKAEQSPKEKRGESANRLILLQQRTA